MPYYVSPDGSSRQGPYEIEQLRQMGIRPDTLIWKTGMQEWQRAEQVSELRGLFSGGAAQSPPQQQNPYAYQQQAGYPQHGYPQQGYGVVPPFNPSDVQSKKLAAGICGILIGGLGIHKFVLGFNTAGVIMLLVTILTCGIGGMVMGVIGLIEGIIYLVKNDQEFYQIYMVEKKEWF